MRAMTAAAVELFSEEGYSAVSTRRIAERAGCSETLLFRYFGDKRGLLMAICNDLRDDDTRLRRPLEAFEDVARVHRALPARVVRALEAPGTRSSRSSIAALINDPEMTADFAQKHDEAVDYVAGVLRQFQAVAVRSRRRSTWTSIATRDRAVELRRRLPAPARVRASGERAAGDREVVGVDPESWSAGRGAAAVARAAQPQGRRRGPRCPAASRQRHRAARGRRAGGRERSRPRRGEPRTTAPDDLTVRRSSSRFDMDALLS